jgi:biopolymer transport protein ExbB
MFDLISTAAEGAAAAAASGQSFSPIDALNKGGIASWSLAIIMAIMSASSWYVTFTKYFEQSKILKQSREGVANFWRAGSIRDGAAKFEKNSAYRQLVDDGIRAEDDHGKFKDPVDQHEWMLTSMQRSQNAINGKLGTGLSVLATVGSTAPFVGLLGTVWGILNALITIGLSGDASIEKVAGPVGEALYMTAFGLIVAVPAVACYNWLNRRNKTIAERLNAFSNDLHGFMMSGGALKPAVKTAAAAPAKAAAPVKA